jgi:hypothetical protein
MDMNNVAEVKSHESEGTNLNTLQGRYLESNIGQTNVIEQQSLPVASETCNKLSCIYEFTSDRLRCHSYVHRSVTIQFRKKAR